MRRPVAALVLAILMAAGIEVGDAHPLGNFSINHHARVIVEVDLVRVHYVVELAELATFQEITSATGRAIAVWSDDERETYRARATARCVAGLALTVDGVVVPLAATTSELTTPEGVGGQPTLRLELGLQGETTLRRDGARFRFEDHNHPGRTGWNEVVVTAGDGVAIFDSTAYASSLSADLRHYPEDQLVAPLQERAGEWSAVVGEAPQGASLLVPREFAPPIRPSTALRSVASVMPAGLPPVLAVLGVLLAVVLGGLEALALSRSDEIDPAPTRAPFGRATLVGLRTVAGELAELVPLALVVWLVAEYVVPERFRLALRAVAGIVIVVIGGASFRRRPPRWTDGRDRASRGAPSGGWLVILLEGAAAHRVVYGMILLVAFVASRVTTSSLRPASRGTEVAIWRWHLVRVVVLIALGTALVVEALVGQRTANLSASW